jgi:hypothetical protein
MKRGLKSVINPTPSAGHGHLLSAYPTRHRRRFSPMLNLAHDFPVPDVLAAAFALYHLAQSVFDIPTCIAHQGELGRAANKMMVRLLRIPPGEMLGVIAATEQWNKLTLSLA